MKHKLLFIAISLMTLFASVEAYAYDFSAVAPSGQTLYYNILGNGKVEVTYRNRYVSYVSGDLVIPSSITHNGTTYSITSIGGDAFNSCSSLTSITIPNSVTSIGEYAFKYCSSLTSITIPNSVTSINRNAFQNCSSLTSVTIPNSVTSIGDGAFSGCSSLTSVTIPNSVTSIGYGAFSGCSSLTSVTIPNSVTFIGYYAFLNCSSLTNVTIPCSVTSIEDDAFRGCSSLSEVFMEACDPPNLGDAVFDYNKNNRVFIVYSCSFDNYYNHEDWANYQNALQRKNLNVLSADSLSGNASINQCGVDGNCYRPSVIATPNYGYHFDHWSNGNTDNPDTLYLTTLDSTVMAFFARNTYTLTANANNTDYGSIAYPMGVTALYKDTLMVVADAAEHYHVSQWQGNYIIATTASKDTAWVLMTDDITVTCTFAIDRHRVTLATNDIAGGIVSGAGEYDYGSSCTVEATPYSGYTFRRWSNGSTANPYFFAVLGDVDLTAIFLPEGVGEFTVTAVSANPTMGTATVNGASTAVVDEGEEITLNATPNGGYRFVRWDDGNTQTLRTLTVTEDKTFTAYFEAEQTPLGIDDIATADLRVYAEGGSIHVTIGGTAPDAFSVYDIMGRPIARIIGSDRTAPLPAGIYMVRLGTMPAKKVVVIR